MQRQFSYLKLVKSYFIGFNQVCSPTKVVYKSSHLGKYTVFEWLNFAREN